MLFYGTFSLHKSACKCFKDLESRLDDLFADEATMLFLPKSFRNKLCKCEYCQNIISNEKLDYLYLKDDLIVAIPEPNTEKLQEILQENDINDFFVKRIGTKVSPEHAISAVEHAKTICEKFAKYIHDNCTENMTITRKDVIDFFTNMEKENVNKR